VLNDDDFVVSFLAGRKKNMGKVFVGLFLTLDFLWLFS
jgi:hypothetical protein